MTLDDVVNKLEDIRFIFEDFISTNESNNNIIIDILNNVDILIYILILCLFLIFITRKVKLW